MADTELAHADVLGGKIDDLRRFVDRRFAELSAEIHASVQMIDFSETNISEQLAGVKSQIAEVLAVPQAASRNSGTELEAVVQTTEAAANRIMEAAEAISDWLQELKSEPALYERISEKVNTIFEACSFQDLTSQRIRRAIDHLHHVESVLNNIGTAEPVEVVPPPQPTAPPGTPDLAQAEIDRLLAG
jgi:chemotaxis protein CheZ